MKSTRLSRRSASVLLRNTARNFLLSFVSYLSVVISRAQVQVIRTESAMPCADTSKRDSGDVVVTNTCAFKIIVRHRLPGGHFPCEVEQTISSPLSNPLLRWAVGGNSLPGRAEKLPEPPEETMNSVWTTGEMSRQNFPHRRTRPK